MIKNIIKQVQHMTSHSRKNPLNGMKRFDVAAFSYIGLVRQRNEDNFLYAFDCSGENLLAVVTDGIGGSRNGEIASGLAAKLLYLFWRDFQVPEQNPEEAVRDFLVQATQSINQRIGHINSIPEDCLPMGTTIVASVFLKNSVVTVNAGDSRMYQISKGQTSQLTMDHNLAGIQRSPDFLADSQQNVLTRFIGLPSVLIPDSLITEVHSGDHYILCSDGLNTHLEDAEILFADQSAESSQDCLRSFRNLARQRGAMDNLTVISVRLI